MPLFSPYNISLRLSLPCLSLSLLSLSLPISLQLCFVSSSLPYLLSHSISRSSLRLVFSSLHSPFSPSISPSSLLVFHTIKYRCLSLDHSPFIVSLALLNVFIVSLGPIVCVLCLSVVCLLSSSGDQRTGLILRGFWKNGTSALPANHVSQKYVDRWKNFQGVIRIRILAGMINGPQSDLSEFDDQEPFPDTHTNTYTHTYTHIHTHASMHVDWLEHLQWREGSRPRLVKGTTALVE